MLIIQSFPRRPLSLNGFAECVLVLTLSERALVFEALDKIKKGCCHEIGRVAQGCRCNVIHWIFPPLNSIAIVERMHSLTRGRPVACRALQTRAPLRVRAGLG